MPQLTTCCPYFWAAVPRRYAKNWPFPPEKLEFLRKCRDAVPTSAAPAAARSTEHRPRLALGAPVGPGRPACRSAVHAAGAARIGHARRQAMATCAFGGGRIGPRIPLHARILALALANRRQSGIIHLTYFPNWEITTHDIGRDGRPVQRSSGHDASCDDNLRTLRTAISGQSANASGTVPSVSGCGATAAASWPGR